MNKYIITGGQGFIGQNVAKLSGGKSFDLKSGFDILNKKQLLNEVDFGMGIFHLAAKISVPESFKNEEEYKKINVSGLENVIEVAKEKSCKVVFSSSAAVYGNYDRKVNEDDKLNPLSPYAKNKLDGEGLLEKSGLEAVCLRYFNVYGPNQSKEYAGVITNFIDRAKKNEDIVIYGDGNQVRDFVHVQDVARANLLAMNYDKSSFEIFNIASGEEITINELARMIVDLTNSKSKIVYKENRQGDIYYSGANIDKAKKLLNFFPKVNLRQGLLSIINK
jgi:UDP-glucose 4-epimerase